MGHLYFLADYLVFVVHVFSPITHASRLLIHLVFSLTTFLKAKKDGAPGVADVRLSLFLSYLRLFFENGVNVV